jgi:GPH family glycoside/pentoside/hexuronide:cation symporter
MTLTADTQQTEKQDNRLTGALLAMYALPTLPLALVILPIGIVLPAFYEAHTTATLAAIGGIAFASRAFDAFTDPLIGFLSDRTRTPIGGRKPWMLIGAVIAALALFQLFTPEASSGIAYYTVWSFMVYIGFTLIDIPMRAWGIELCVNYDERSRISTYVTTFTVLGSVAFWLALIIQAPFTGTTELTPGVFRGIGWIFAFLLPALIILAVVRIPTVESVNDKNPTLKDMIASFRGNRPMWRFVAAYALWATGNGIFTVLFYIFIKDYMLLGQQFPFLMLAYFGVQVASMPIWLKIMLRYGKHRSWSVSFALQATLPWLILLIEPGANAFLPALALTALLALVAGGILVVPMALLGDIVDYDILKTGVNRAGNYFAINTLMQKFGMGAGMGIGLPVIAAFGYHSGVEITGWVKFGLIFTYLALPTVFGLSAAAVIWGFPLDSRRHGIIRRRIEQRNARNTVTGTVGDESRQTGQI